MASRIDYSQSRELYIGTTAEVTVDDGNAIIEGKIGIGTTNPSTPLHVIGIAQIVTGSDVAFYEGNGVRMFGTQNYRFRNTGGGVRAIIDVNSTGVNAGNLTLYNASNVLTTKINNAGNSYFNGGNVGIGEDTPLSTLHVSGTAGNRFTEGLRVERSTVPAQFAMFNYNGGSLNIIATNTAGTGTSMKFQKSNDGSTLTDYMVIDNSGNVGIGTTPSYLLDLYQSTGTTTSNDGTTLQRLWNYVGSDLQQQKTFIDFVFADDNDNEYPQVRIGAEVGQNGNAGTQILEGSGAFVVYTNNATGVGPGSPTGLAERFRVDYQGNVGIGTTSPAKKLTIATDTVNDGVYITTSGGTNVARIGTSSTATSGALALLAGGSTKVFISAKANENSYFNGGGNVGIKTTSPQAPLHVVTNTDLSDALILEFAGTYQGGPYQTFQYNEGGSSPSENGDLIGGIRARTAYASGTYAGYSTAIEFRNDGNPTSTSTPGGITFLTTAVNATTVSQRMRINNDGTMQFNAYGAGTLVSDASGNITVSSGGGAGGPYLPLAGGIMNTNATIDMRGNLRFASTSVGTSPERFIQYNEADVSVENALGFKAGGGTTVYGYMNLGDNIELMFGDDSDLRMKHDGADSFIDNNTGHLYIRNKGNDKDVYFQNDNGVGGLANYFYLDGGIAKTVFSRDAQFLDNVAIQVGSSADLKISHDGTDSFIEDSGTGSLYVTTNAFRLLNPAENEQIITAFENGAVNLFYDSSQKFETTSAGVSVTGSLSTTEDISVAGTLMVSGTTTAGGTLICESNITVQDSDKILIGNSGDLELYHSGSQSYIKDVGTGDLNILADDLVIGNTAGDPYFTADDGGSSSMYADGIRIFSAVDDGAASMSYFGFGSATTSSGSGYGYKYGANNPGTTQGLCITTSDTGGAYFDGVAQFQNTSTSQGAGMFQMINFGSLYGRYMNFYRGSTSNIIGYIGYNGTNTSVTFSTTSSDIRTKKNIATWDENVLDKFKALQPKRFNFKAEKGDPGLEKERGFIAQYEKDNFPEVYQLNGPDDDAKYGFHPMEMVPYLMKAVKDLVIKTEELERRIKTLES